MLGFRKSMQDVVYLQHIALVMPSPDFTEGPQGGSSPIIDHRDDEVAGRESEAPSPARAQRASASVRRGPRLRFWSDCVIAFDPPRFGMRVRNPRLPRRQSHDRLHVGACRVRDRYVVDMEAINH